MFFHSVRETNSANGATALPQLGAVLESWTANGPIKRHEPSRCSKNHSRPQCFVRNPVQEICVNHRAYRFHDIARKTVTRGCIGMQDAKARVEPESSDGKPRFRFKHGIKVVEHRVQGIRGEPW